PGARFFTGNLCSTIAVQMLAIERPAGAGLAVEGMTAVQLELLFRLPLRLHLGLLPFPGQLLRLALGLGLQAGPFRPRFRALLLALLLAGCAFAADRLQIGFEVVSAVVVVDLLARLDVLDGADEDLALARLDVGFRG